jgi:nucleotide-binding universal stress UspA family protein
MEILLAVDGAAGSDRAVELLAGYRGDATQTRIVALNVQSRPVAIWPEAAIDVRAVEAALLADGQQIADRAASRLKTAGMGADPVVRLGYPSDGVLREAKAREAGMILMGTRGHGALRGFALGSVAMRVAHASPVPVWLVQPESRLPAQLGRSLRVMLALDGSEPALRAASTLASWRGWLGDLDIQIVYVQQPLTYLETVLPPHDDLIEQWSTRAGESAAQAARQLFAKEGIRNHLHLTAGDVATEIAHLASQTGCELIALGTRGLGAAHHALIGSVALKVVAHAAVPVVLVK